MKMTNSITKDQKIEKAKSILPSFGLISALPIASMLLPLALVMLGVIFFHKGKDPTLFFLFFTIIARLTGDWMFWTKYFPQEMDTKENDENWRASVKNILTSQASAIKAINDMVIDAVVDGILLFFAFKSAAPPMWILFVYSFCQGIGAPIQGIIVRMVDRRYARKFSMIVTALATFMVLEINGVISIGYIKILGLSQFSVSSLMLFVIGCKGLLTSTTVIAKDIIAETLKLKTMKN